MKFKPIYFYGIIVLAAIAFLFILTPKENSEQLEKTSTLQQDKLPDDEIHNPLKSGTNKPGKENVSENFRIKMDELKNAVTENPNDTLKLKEYADFLAAAHKVDEAIEFYDKILKIDPTRTDINFTATILYYNKGDLNKAEEYNERVLKYDPANRMALYNRGAIAATRGDKEKARDIWQKIIDKYPDTDVGNLAKESLSRL